MLLNLLLMEALNTQMGKVPLSETRNGGGEDTGFVETMEKSHFGHV